VYDDKYNDSIVNV